jgi:hypothetical protein
MRRWRAAAVAVLLVAACGSAPEASPPLDAGGGVAALEIPANVLRFDARADRPVEDPDARWVRSSGRTLEPLFGRCAARAPETVAARQVALVEPTLWKVERLAVYRDAEAARTMMAQLGRCRRYEDGEGTVTEWSVQPLPDIGDEALFVGSRRRQDEDPVPGSHRGVVVREGRAVVMYVDFGPRTQLPERTDVARYEAAAGEIAWRLAQAPWLERASG